MTTACRSTPNELGLLCVQLQPVATRPPRDVIDAMRHADLKRTGIRRPTRPRMTLTCFECNGTLYDIRQTLLLIVLVWLIAQHMR